MSSTTNPRFCRIDAVELREALDGPSPPLLLDVRIGAAFSGSRIPGALPLPLDADPLRIPDVPRDRAVIAYCPCSGETSSSRVARWLVEEGYRDVGVLAGGLQSWIDAGYELEAVEPSSDDAGVPWMEIELTPPPGAAGSRAGAAEAAFLAGRGFLDGRTLPMKRELVPVFVDMVESTELVLHRSPEEVLAVLQEFMEVVIDVGWYHCGDVHDFEGDGALLYFQGPGEAVPAAFRLRDELLRRHRANPDVPLPRVSLDVGMVVAGIVGTRFRQTVALVGPAVHRAARILKLAPPGGIAATEPIVVHARRSHPELARSFERSEHDFVLDLNHPDPAAFWVSRPGDPDLGSVVEHTECCSRMQY